MLNPKQKKFALEYMIDFNGTRAAIAAGYSDSCAGEIAHENLRKPHIAQFIKEKLEAQCSSIGLTREMVLVELAKYAFRRNLHSLDISPRDSISALKLLGQHLGLFWERPPEEENDYKRALRSALEQINKKKT